MPETQANIKAKGHVKVELYDSSGRVFDSLETHNVVTNVASKIIIETLAKPGGFNVYETTETHDTPSVSADDGFYHITLSQHRYVLSECELNGTGSYTYQVPGSGRLEVLREVLLDYNPVVIGEDVWISDPETREIRFRTAPSSGALIQLKYLDICNIASRIEPYSETIKVGVTTYARSTTKNLAGKYIPTENTYVIDYDTGDVAFDRQLTGISVTYKYLASCGVTYMGISNKPADAPAGLPIVFTDANRNKLALDAEYPGTRQLIKSPSQVIFGTQAEQPFTGNGTTTDFVLPNKPVASLDQVLVNGSPVAIGTAVTLYDAESGIVRFTVAPQSGALIQIKYTYYLSATAVFVADFPPGVPGKEISPCTDRFTTSSSKTTYPLTYVPYSVTSVTLNGTPLVSGTDYAVNTSTKTIVLTSSPPDGGTLVVEYTWEKDYAEIYEVGLFDRQTGGSMFAISGIGPITKDQNTGMRVSWSTTLTMA